MCAAVRQPRASFQERRFVSSSCCRRSLEVVGKKAIVSMLGLSTVLATGLATAQVRIYLYARDVDMRKSFNGLCAIVQSEFKTDIRLGDLFLFLNRRNDRVKLMYWDRDGIAIWMKRLESGTFQRPMLKADQHQVEIDSTDLSLLLSGIDLKSAKRRKRYLVDDKSKAIIQSSSS